MTVEAPSSRSTTMTAVPPGTTMQGGAAIWAEWAVMCVGVHGDEPLGGGIHVGDSAVGADLGWDCGDRVGEDIGLQNLVR